MHFFHQKTAFRRILEILPQIGSNLAYHLPLIIAQITKNVKYCVEVAGFAPAEPWMISQIPYSSTPTRRKVYHILTILSLLFISLFPIPYSLFPTLASHPPEDNTFWQYCESATNSRWQNGFYLPDDPPNHIPLGTCPADTDCTEEPFGEDQDEQITRCVPRDSGSPPGSTTNLGPDAAGLTQIEAVFSRVISLFVGLAFVALFVVLVLAGIKFLTSGGDPKALQAARNTVTWALLGILFLVIAWLVLQLIAAFTGIEGLKTFDVKT